MRISDWSSDVCSSDLRRGLEVQGEADHRHGRARLYGRIRREDLQAARRLRQLWLSRKPCGELRSHRLCVLLAQMLRSEEHTSELQSLMRISYAVFCLKKKNIHTNTVTSATHQSTAKHTT